MRVYGHARLWERMTRDGDQGLRGILRGQEVCAT